MALKKSLKRAGKQSAKKARPDPNHLLPGKTPVMQGGMPKALGIRITSLSPRKVTAEMPVTPMHLNMNDFAIEVPSYLGVTVKPDVDVIAQFDVIDE